VRRPQNTTKPNVQPEKSGNKGRPTTTRNGEKLPSYAFFFPSFLQLPEGAEFLSFKSTLRRLRPCINMRGQYLDTLTSGSCNTGNGLFSKEVLAMRNFF